MNRERRARPGNAGAVLAGMERVRASMRGRRPEQSRIDTVAEFEAMPVTPPPAPSSRRLMTLSSPGSEPPAKSDDTQGRPPQPVATSGR